MVVVMVIIVLNFKIIFVPILIILITFPVRVSYFLESTEQMVTRGGQSGGAGGAQATPGILIFQKQVTPQG